MARVLFVGNEPRTFLSHRAPLAEAARKAGHDVHVALPRGEGWDEVRARFSVHEYPLSRRGIAPVQEWRSFRALLRLFREVRPDLVHLVTIKPIVHGGAAARRARVPAVVHAVTGLGFVFTSDALLARLLRPIIVRAYRRAFAQENARIVFQNPDDLELFVARGIVARGRAVLIPSSGVDMRGFAPSAEPPEPCVVGLPARLLVDKGVRDFVEAARILRREGAPVRMVLLGAGDPGNPASIPDAEVESWVEEGAVEAWGWQTDMAAAFAKVHLACLPSYREGVPRALLEAAACGRALVATDVPGCRLAVAHGVNGLLVPPRDPRALAEAIRALAADPERRRAMGAAGRRLVEERFTTGRVAAATLEVYADLLLARK